MEKHLKPEIMNPSRSHPSEPDSSKIENDKPIPTVISMSPEYPKYRNTLIIFSVIFLLVVFIGGGYLLIRHTGSSIRIFIYTKDIERNPGDTDAYFYRGYAYYRKGQFDKAISDYSKVIEINPKHPWAYFNRGNAYHAKGEYDKAISDHSKEIEINPESVWSYNALAWLLATCPDERYRNGVKAIELAEKALEIMEVGYIVDTLAAAYAEVGRFEDAIMTQERAIALLKKEESKRNTIDECVEHLNSYKVNKPWREK